MAPATKDLTEKEHALIVNAWKSLKTSPEIDWDKFARLGGYTNLVSGKNAMATIRKKLDAQAEADGEQPVAAPSKAVKAAKPKTGGKRKKVAVEGDDDEAAPAKAAKRGSKKSDKTAKEEESKEEESKEESEDNVA